jgi:signal peptidase II
VSGPTHPDGGSDLDHSPLPAAPTAPDAGPRATSAWTPGTGRPIWALFVGLAVAVVVLDQLSKAWVIASIDQGSAIHLVGDLVRLIDSHNSGALFGLFGSSAPVLAVASIAVIGSIVWFHARSGRNPVVSIALGLLLGGAIGNLVDRIRLGYVVDWVDMGIGSLRFWTFNVGDAAISVALLLLVVIALFPGLGGSSTDG